LVVSSKYRAENIISTSILKHKIIIFDRAAHHVYTTIAHTEKGTKVVNTVDIMK